jgi:hypothetical protein
MDHIGDLSAVNELEFVDGQRKPVQLDLMLHSHSSATPTHHFKQTKNTKLVIAQSL